VKGAKGTGKGKRGLPLKLDKPMPVLIMHHIARPLRIEYEGAVYHNDFLLIMKVPAIFSRLRIL
jgi:hypothetical protein